MSIIEHPYNNNQVLKFIDIITNSFNFNNLQCCFNHSVKNSLFCVSYKLKHNITPICFRI